MEELLLTVLVPRHSLGLNTMTSPSSIRKQGSSGHGHSTGVGRLKGTFTGKKDLDRES